MKDAHKIERSETAYDSVKITLRNGIVVHLSSNPGYLNLSVSGIGDNPLEIKDQAANQLNIAYKQPK